MPYGLARTPDMDAIKISVFKYATQSGITWGIDDGRAKAVIAKAKAKSDEVLRNGAKDCSEGERIRKILNFGNLRKTKLSSYLRLCWHGSVYDMVHSGAAARSRKLRK